MTLTGSLHSIWLELKFLLVLYKLWYCYSYSSQRVLCPAMWSLVLHILSLVFSNRPKEAPMQFAWTPFLHSSFLSDTLSYKFQTPQTSWTHISYVPSTQSLLNSAWALPYCAVASKVPPGRKLRKLQDSSVCSLLSSSLRGHSCVLSIVQCLTTVEVSLSLLLILLFKLSQILSVGTPSRWLFFLFVLLICPQNFLSILSDTIGYSKLTLYFPCPRQKIRIFSRKNWHLFFFNLFFYN